jgi:REP element-mobilizing transposase RayT
MFLSIPPKLSLSDVMQRIKGRSSRRIQMEFPELRKRYWGRRFWARGIFRARPEMSPTISYFSIWNYIPPNDATGASR